MKKLFVFLMICISVCHARAQEIAPMLPDIQMYEVLQKFNKGEVSDEDTLIELLFAMPVEYHQYIMPMVGGMRSISEKTRMMPGIVEWRRKLPTVIAPDLQEYAQKHLKYLSPTYYPFLMPEAWPSYYDHHDEHEESKWPTFVDISTPDKKDAAFPSKIEPDSTLAYLLSPVKLTPQTAQPITESDITSVTNIISKFKALESGPEGQQRTTALLFDFLDKSVMLDAFVNPCASMVKRFERIDQTGWLDIQLKKENMTKADYVNKCDRIVKAYRVQLSNSAKIQDLKRILSEAMKEPEDSVYRKLYLVWIDMHRTNRNDVKAIRGHEKLLNKVFKGRRMIMSTPVVLDF